LHAFIVNLENRRGTLADLGTALGERGINITGLAGTTWEGAGSVAIVTNDDSATTAALDETGLDYRECELVSVQIEDRPGALGEAARRLADRGVNIELVMPIDAQGQRATVTFGVDDVERAREALGELAAAGPQAV
jgi:hypothetical protein